MHCLCYQALAWLRISSFVLVIRTTVARTEAFRIPVTAVTTTCVSPVSGGENNVPRV